MSKNNLQHFQQHFLTFKPRMTRLFFQSLFYSPFVSLCICGEGFLVFSHASTYFHSERPLLPLVAAGARNLIFLSFRFLVQRADSEWHEKKIWRMKEEVSLYGSAPENPAQRNPKRGWFHSILEMVSKTKSYCHCESRRCKSGRSNLKTMERLLLVIRDFWNIHYLIPFRA